jgi:hypothetical protein
MSELIAVWSKVAFASDPRVALTTAGFVLSPELETRLAATGSQLAQRAQLVELLGGVPPVDVAFTVGSEPRLTSRSLPTGEFDVVVSLRLEILSQVLDGLYQAFVWPHGLPSDDVPAILLDRLRTLSDDVPDGDGLTMGALHLTAAPTVTAGPEGALRLSQPFRLEVDAVGPPRTTMTSLTGVLHYLVQPIADTVGAESRQFVLGLGTEETEELSVDGDSLIQPRDDDALREFSEFVAALVALARTRLPRDVSVSPLLGLPFSDEVPVQILGARTTSAPTESGAGAVHVGVMVGFGDDVAVPDEIPETVALAADPFGESSVNVVATVHESTLQTALTASIPLIEKKANAKADALPISIPEIVVDSTGLEIDFPDTIRTTVKAKIRDFCGLIFNTIDLDFTVSADATIQQILDGTIVVEVDPGVDFDNTDIALCALTSIGDLLTLNIFDVVVTVGAVIGRIVAANSDALEPRSFDMNGVFEADRPVPLTELAVRAELLQAGVRQGGDRFELRGTVTLPPDADHLFVYVRVLQESEFGGGGPFRPTFPVADATVEVRDQDNPLSPGDDVRPFPTEPEITLAGGVLSSVTRRLELGQNERMGRSITDDSGLARLVVSRTGGSSGTVVTTTTIGNPQTGVTTTFETRGPGIELLPDVYLRVRLPDGRRFDSVDLEGESGLRVNYGAGRLGSPDSPITLVVPPPPLVDPEADPT